MEVRQSNLFKQVYKKLHKNQLDTVNTNIQLIINDPTIGDKKVGDLLGISVHKFKIQNHLYLLAYSHEVELSLLYLIALGEHENFYSKLKKYM